MGAAIQKTYENGLWYGRSHPAKETMNNDKVWSQPSMKTQVWSQPSINESCNDHPQNRSLDHNRQIQGLALHLDPNKVQVQACEYMS